MKYIAIILSTLCLLSSCGKMLDLYPHSAISPDAVTPKDLPAMRLGMYNRVQNEPTARGFIICDLLGGDITQSVYNPIDVIKSFLSPLNSTITSMWNGYYSALYQVNNVLATATKLSDTKVMGEAYYFRAYIYYNLVSLWGGVPLLRQNTMEKLPRSSADEVWALIEEDLENAISMLPSTSSYYYVSRNAALALKARVLLHEGKKTEAAKIAEDLITKGGYDLDSFENTFYRPTVKVSKETIFAFQNISQESNINISDLFYTYGMPNKGQGLYNPTAELVKLYDDKDNRKAISIVNVSGTNIINKYPSGQTGTDPVVVSRLAEMYLISAEAQGRGAGITRLNDLRKKRGLGEISVGTDEQFINALLDERRREFLGENFMYRDLVRTGKAIERLGVQKYQLLLPIPGKELLLNPLLEPNPGY